MSASRLQVLIHDLARQSEKSRHFERWLGPLKDALGDALVR